MTYGQTWSIRIRRWIRIRRSPPLNLCQFGWTGATSGRGAGDKNITSKLDSPLLYSRMIRAKLQGNNVVYPYRRQYARSHSLSPSLGVDVIDTSRRTNTLTLARLEKFEKGYCTDDRPICHREFRNWTRILIEKLRWKLSHSRERMKMRGRLEWESPGIIPRQSVRSHPYHWK